MTAVRTYTIFQACFQNWVMVVHTRANQLLTQLLTVGFDTLPP